MHIACFFFRFFFRQRNAYSVGRRGRRSSIERGLQFFSQRSRQSIFATGAECVVARRLLTIAPLRLSISLLPEKRSVSECRMPGSDSQWHNGMPAGRVVPIAFLGPESGTLLVLRNKRVA